MFDRRKVLGRGVRGGDAPFPEEEAARGNQAASYMQILSLATMHLLHLLLYFALCYMVILYHICEISDTLTSLELYAMHFLLFYAISSLPAFYV